LIEVQQVKEFVQESAEKVYELEAAPLDKALTILAKLNIPIHKTDTACTLSVAKVTIPDIIKELALADVKIFSVKEVTKSLEDRFLEVTKQEGREHK
jgi:ABC-2 type transport system ATP-binding protein